MISVAPLFETQCAYVEATLGEFLAWTGGETGPAIGPFCDYSRSDFWAYADYKYIASLFQHKATMFEVTISLLSGFDSMLWRAIQAMKAPVAIFV